MQFNLTSVQMRVWSRITMLVLMSFKLKIRKIKLKHKKGGEYVRLCVYVSGFNGVIFSLRFLWFVYIEQFPCSSRMMM